MRLPEHASHLPCRFFPPLAACAPGPALPCLALLTGLAALPHLPDCSTVLSLWGQSPTFAYHVRPFWTLRCHAACASATGNSLQVPTQHTATRCTCCFPRPPSPVPQLTATSTNTLWPTFAGPVRCSSFGAQRHLVRSLFIISLQAGLRGRPRASSPRPSSPNEPHLASDTQADADFRGRAHSDGHPAPSPHTQRIKRVPCCASIKEFSVAIHRHDEKESGERFHANQRLKIR